MPIDSPFDIHHIRCPHCGHTFDYAPPLPVTQELSPLAYAILTARGVDAAKWRRGAWVTLMRWADMVLSNRESVRVAMLELVNAGYVMRVPVGTGRRAHYLAIPTMVARLEEEHSPSKKAV